MQPRFYWQIHTLAFQLEKRADENLKSQLGIGFAQYKVLEAVCRSVLAKQNTIASILGQTEASISRQVKILEKKGLLIVGTVMENRRARELTLTEAGEELLRHAEEMISLTQNSVMQNLSFEEQQLLQQLFERLGSTR